MAVKVKIEIKGLNELKRKLKADVLAAAPLTEAITQVEGMLGTSWRTAMPVASGQARAKIATKRSSKPIPTWAKVKTSATRSSARYKRYRYAGRQEYGPGRNKGRLTRAVDGVRNKLQGVLSQAARKIESRWGA